MSTPIIVALDHPTLDQAVTLAKTLDPALCRLKIANTLFTRYGPAAVDALQKLGFEIFLDLKYHDIPNQVAGSCLSAARLGVWMITLHCSGGIDMLSRAREAINKASHQPIMVGVTVLTSLSSTDLSAIGYKRPLCEQVLHLAELAQQAGLDGVVSSAEEVSMLKEHCGDDFVCVTPGIRLAMGDHADQKRVVTPEKAVINGSDYLVIGRAITEANDPARAVEEIANLL